MTRYIYSAAALATRLGVSSSPVREAMLTLVSEGLMEPVRNRGLQLVPVPLRGRLHRRSGVPHRSPTGQRAPHGSGSHAS
ncbi:GntR family transcriptional regulator [Streptomyces chartreusis]